MKAKLLLFFLLLASFSLRAQQRSVKLNLSTAQKILGGCLTFADSAKLNMAAAIYDSHGQLVIFARMDGASVGSAKAAHWKGLSAATYQYSTAQTAKWNVPNAPDISTVPGGIPIKTVEGFVLGAIGVSGAASSIDVKCAEAGIKAASSLGIIAWKD
jgi:uncharacterized protein GlcG (DUF336 family)